MLWDVMILFMALFGNFSKDLVVLENLLDLPPAKFLGLGTDQLLTGYFRGGAVGSSSVLSENEKQKQKELTVKRDGRELLLFVEDKWLTVDGCWLLPKPPKKLSLQHGLTCLPWVLYEGK